jgi:putative phosphoesterase
LRVAVISDTHLPRGSRTLPDACVERLRAADLVVHAGDVTGLEFWKQLQRLGPPVVGVRGNVDEPALAALLPETRVVEAEGGRLGVVHVGGPRLGRDERLRRRFPGCGAIVYGHSHLPQREFVDGVWILNPGSPTERRRAPSRTMLDLVVEHGRIVPELVDLGR